METPTCRAVQFAISSPPRALWLAWQHGGFWLPGVRDNTTTRRIADVPPVIGYEASRWVSDGQKRSQQIEQRIDRIKRALLEIGPMRPGSLTRQYKDPQHQAGAYWQISYTRRMKSRTEYVRREWVKEMRRQTATHKRFKRLVDQWIDLSIEHSRLTM